MDGLTPRQEAYFKELESRDSSDVIRRTIEAAKEDLRHDSGIVRGFTRVKGFQPNPTDKT